MRERIAKPGPGPTAAMAAIIVAATAGSALADIETSTRYRHYTISGATALQLVKDMVRRGPKVGGGEALASIDSDVKFDGRFRPGSRCAIQDLDIKARFVITLPRLRAERAVPRRTRGNFRAFYNSAKRHEETHRAISLKCLGRIRAKVRGLRKLADCQRVKRQIRRIVDAEGRICRRQHDAFDRREQRKLWASVFMRQVVAEAKASNTNTDQIRRSVRRGLVRPWLEGDRSR